MERRRTDRLATESHPWRPAKERPRRVSAALRAYAALTTSASRGAIRDVTQLARR